MYFKMAPQRDNRVKVSALLSARHKVSEVANLVGLAQASTRSRSTWTMAKVSTEVQVVVDRVLWTITACGMPLEGLLRMEVLTREFYCEL